MKKVNCCIIISAIISVIYIIIDYFNIPGKLGISVERINLNGANIFLNVGALIFIFALTYFLVDKHNENARVNQRNIVRYMMVSDYNECKNRIHMFKDKEIKKNVLSKIDYDQTLDKSSSYYNLVIIAFRNSNSIEEYAKQGIVDISYYKEYDKIKREYESYVTLMVLAKGNDEVFEDILVESQNLLNSKIDAAIKCLTE